MKIERYTFWYLLKAKEYQIIIPELQRDYAQGRRDERSTQVRIRFVKALFDALQSTGNQLHLDFVYGTQTEDKKAFIPIDGQQRLTTLYLLHWYLTSQQEEALEKFSYATRITSSEFCNVLSHHLLKLSDTLPTPSASIKDCRWYKPEWNYDPTVQGMLVMLDEIHTLFKDCNRQEMWNLLTDQEGENARITFDFLDMLQANLRNDLYIKMNSRGKQLTDWENFKADLQKYVDETCGLEQIKNWNGLNIKNEEVSWKELIDTEWTDIFWANKDKDNFLVDEEWLRFLKGMALICYAKETGGIIKPEHKELINKLFRNEDSYLSIGDFKAIGFLSKDNLEYMFECLESIKGDKLKSFDEILSSLDLIAFTNAEETVKEELLIFKRNISRSARYRSRLFLFAFFEGIRNAKTIDANFDYKAFLSWMRLWRNLLQNSGYGNEANFIQAIASIQLISEKWEKGKDFKPLVIHEKAHLKGFVDDVLKEEIQKLELIKEKPDLELLFLKAENNEVLQGRIGFILEISKMENGELDEGLLEMNIAKTNEIISFSSISGSLFPDEKDYLLHRAILSVYDYSIWASNPEIWSYGRANRTVWLQILNRSDEFKNLKIFFQRAQNQSLQDMINGFVEEDYRFLLVKYNYFFPETWYNRIWWPNDDGSAFPVLLAQQNRSANNWELHTLWLYKMLMESPEQLLPLPIPVAPTSNFYYAEESYVTFLVESQYEINIHYEATASPTERFCLTFKPLSSKMLTLASELISNRSYKEHADNLSKNWRLKGFGYKTIFDELKWFSIELATNYTHALKIPTP